MSIMPLPVFEADADPHHRSAMTDQEIYDRLEAPKSIVVRFGSMKLVGEFPYDGQAKPGCGSKLVIRTHRGTEIGEMLTSTCANAGCSKSVTRNEMLEYIENSGGRDYPFHTDGRILRVATIDDLNTQSALDTIRVEAVKVCKAEIIDLNLKMKLVEAEPILGGELLTFYYMSEERVDFRDLVRRLAAHFKTRIEMRQVGARDEARLVADYERCGQHCCCKNFLKVLTPVSMSAAKRQKATLEPLKISGRCGRLMCCLRYEDQTYKELRAALPKRNTRVGTAEGPGVVIDSKVLVQLVLVRLDFEAKEIAVPVEELMDPDNCPPPGTVPAAQKEADGLRGLTEEEVVDGVDDRNRRQRNRYQQQDQYRQRSQDLDAGRDDRSSADESDDFGDDINRGPAMVNFDQPIDPDRGGDQVDVDAGAAGDGEQTGEDARSTDERGGRRRRRGGKRRRRGSQRNPPDVDGGAAAQGDAGSPSADQPRPSQPGPRPERPGADDQPGGDGGGRRRRRRGGRRRRRGGAGGGDAPNENG